jgi:hypothetical protein
MASFGNTFLKSAEFLKNRNFMEFVIPAKLVPAGFKPGAGIQGSR